MSDSWDPAEPTRFLCPWDFPGKDTRVGCHFLLQGIFPTQVSNPRLVHCRWILYHWGTKEACFYNIILTTKGKAQWNIMALLFSANQPRRRADITRAVSQMVSCQLNITSVSTFSAVTGGARALLWGPYSPELDPPKRDTHLKGRKAGDCRAGSLMRSCRRDTGSTCRQALENHPPQAETVSYSLTDMHQPRPSNGKSLTLCIKPFTLGKPRGASVFLTESWLLYFVYQNWGVERRVWNFYL